jgi:hypothetical protein
MENDAFEVFRLFEDFEGVGGINENEGSTLPQ